MVAYTVTKLLLSSALKLCANCMLRLLTFAWFNYSVQACPDVKYGKRIHVLPIDDTVEGLTGYVCSMCHHWGFVNLIIITATIL